MNTDDDNEAVGARGVPGVSCVSCVSCTPDTPCPPRTPRSTARRRLALLLATAGVMLNVASNFVGIDGCDGGHVLQLASGNAQSGVATAPLGHALVVGVQCRGETSGDLVAARGEEVAWTVTAGGGLVDGRPSTTTRAGESREPSTVGAAASVHWQLGSALGEQTVEVRSGGQALTFRATAVAPTPGGTCAGGGGTDLQALRHVSGEERWNAAGSPYRGERVRVQGGASLTIEAGVGTCLDEIVVEPGASLVVAGEAATPVRMAARAGSTTGWRLEIEFPAPPSGAPPAAGAAAAPARSTLRHLQASNLVRLASAGAIDLTDARLVVDGDVDRGLVCPLVRWTALPDGAPTLARVVIDGYGGAGAAGCAALTLAAMTTPPAGPRPVQVRVLAAGGDAIALTGTAPNAFALTNCEIAGAGGRGLVVTAGSRADVLSITGCNLTGNAGRAIDNEAPATGALAARGNWWGSAAGAPASGANAVSAGVDVAQPLPAPVVLGY